MCGIFGAVYEDEQTFTEARLNRCHLLLNHRGPDHYGSFTERGVRLGMNRLSIIDLSTGNQPIFNGDGSLVIVYNGELYNHALLRQELADQGHRFHTSSDAETLLHTYEQYGASCLERLNGMFAFAVWNRKERTLFLARDRLGIKPLYIRQFNGGLAFASEAKALADLTGEGAKPDWTAIHRYFSFGYVPSPHSPFTGVDKIPAGTYAVFNGKGLEVCRYWAPRYGGGPSVPMEEALAEVDARLRRAVELELMSDVPVGIFLSGGLDSSAVAAYASQLQGPRLKSFALRFKEQTHDESADARLVAKHLGLSHHELEYTAEMLRDSLFDVADTLDEPFGDPTVLPLLALSKYTREHIKTVLTGWGGDEIFAGYPTYKAHRMAAWWRTIPSCIRKSVFSRLINMLPVSDKYMSFEFKAKQFVKGDGLPYELQHFEWMGYFNGNEKQNLFSADVLNAVHAGTLDDVARITAQLTERDIIDRIMHLDAVYFLEGNGLFQADRMTMAASLEARVPLLNPVLCDYVNPLPSSMKMHGGTTKGLLKKVLAQHLPASIINKPKKGFGPPSAQWVRNDFGNVFDDLFSESRVRTQGIFKHDEIARLLKEHRARKANHGRKLWALLSFQMWYDRFIIGG